MIFRKNKMPLTSLVGQSPFILFKIIITGICFYYKSLMLKDFENEKLKKFITIKMLKIYLNVM